MSCWNDDGVDVVLSKRRKSVLILEDGRRIELRRSNNLFVLPYTHAPKPKRTFAMARTVAFAAVLCAIADSTCGPAAHVAPGLTHAPAAGGYATGGLSAPTASYVEQV